MGHVFWIQQQGIYLRYCITHGRNGAQSTYAGRPGGVRRSPDVVSIDICDHILEHWLAVQLLRVDQNKERLFFLFTTLAPTMTLDNGISNVGEIRRHPDFGSRYVTARTVEVWLPRAYAAEPNRRFPVLYMQDGQNLFDPAVSFGGITWGVPKVVSGAIENGEIRPVIVVGIWNTRHRGPEYLPKTAVHAEIEQAGMAFANNPVADDYLRFMAEEVKPFVDALRGVAHHDETKSAELRKSLERIKWLLWHGNLQRALAVIEDFEEDVDELDVDYPNLRKFARTAHEFAVYITSNAGSLINYGERISSCLAESTVNAVISKRFAKRQQMQWTPRGGNASV
jgi:hypothetical protein